MPSSSSLWPSRSFRYMSSSFDCSQRRHCLSWLTRVLVLGINLTGVFLVVVNYVEAGGGVVRKCLGEGVEGGNFEGKKKGWGMGGRVKGSRINCFRASLWLLA